MSQRIATNILPQNVVEGVTAFNSSTGDEKIAKLTSVVFNPQNLRMYQIALVILFILFIWLTEFSHVALIIKSLFIVTIFTLLVVESVIIFSYNK